MKYSNKPLWKKIVESPVSSFVFLLIFVFVARAAWNMYEKASVSDKRLNQALATLAKQSSLNDTLSEKVAYLATDQGVESEIRTKFHAAREGEFVAVIIGDSQTGNSGQASSTSVVLSWWQKLLQVFGL
jgi:hypothetical protein